MKDNNLLRVAYLSPGWPLSDYPNGIVAYVENILSGLDDNVRATVLASDMEHLANDSFVLNLRDYNDRYANLPYKVLNKALSKLNYTGIDLVNYKTNIRNAASMIKNAIDSFDEPLDILEAEESFGSTYHAIGKSKTKFITRLHGPWFTMKEIFNLEDDDYYNLRVFYEGESIKKSHGITAPSLDVLEKVREYYNIELPDAKVIANPVPLVNEDARWVYDDKKSYILFVGRFDEHKGGDLMIQAFNIIAQSDKEVELYFVGPDRGVVVNGNKLNIDEYIAENIKDQSVRSRIKFYGHCGSEEISSLRQKARVTACCSRYENFPVSLLEALATGCPAVATAVGGIKEIIVDDQTGLFAMPESIESIAEKVLILLKDTEKSKRLSENAIKDMTQRFSPKKIAAQSVTYYQSVLNQN